MNSELKIIQDNFPDLSVCELVKRSDSSVIEQSVSGFDEVKRWASWVSKSKTAFDMLRVRLTDEKELIVKDAGNGSVLVIVNSEENTALLLNFLKGIKRSTVEDEPVKTTQPEEKVSDPEIDLKIKDAVRIQRLIIPQESALKENFKNFFVFHQQQDVVGGDFYWYKKVGNCVALALVDCTGHSVEGAMTTMVCNSLLNQSLSVLDPSNLSAFVKEFYRLLNEYNSSTVDQDDYGIGAELGFFCFNYDDQTVRMLSTGISAFIKSDEGIELIKSKKVMDYAKVDQILNETAIPMNKVTGLYTFTDGLTDQYDSEDAKKLGYKGVQRMIESESNFNSDYYKGEITKWKGDNIQYDDITLLGFAI